MKPILRLLGVVTVFALFVAGSLSFPARAQGAGDPSEISLDLLLLGASAAAFGRLFVAPFIALIKARASWFTGGRTVALSFATSVLGAYLLWAAGVLSDAMFARLAAPWSWIWFGIFAFIAASGTVDLVRSQRRPTTPPLE